MLRGGPLSPSGPSATSPKSESPSLYPGVRTTSPLSHSQTYQSYGHLHSKSQPDHLLATSAITAASFASQPWGEPAPLQECPSGFSGDPSPLQQRQRPRPLSFHTRQQSLTHLLPLSLRNRPVSPERRKDWSPSEDMPLTGDGRSSRSRSGSPGLTSLPGWLSSSGLGTGFTMDGGMSTSPTGSTASTTETTPTKLQSQTSDSTTTPKSSTTTSGSSRFAFLASSMSTLQQRLSGATAGITKNAGSAEGVVFDGELLNMNVESALFPQGPPTERDTFSPAAFKNLQANAAGLLARMQGAYRQSTVALREVERERMAQREELEEAETRIRHFRMQLEGMALKAAEQEREMRNLVSELNVEKKARVAAERRAAAASVARSNNRISSGSTGGVGGGGGGGGSSSGVPSIIMSEGSSMSEDLGAEDDQRRLRQRRGWRKSTGTVKSDQSYESGEDEDGGESAEEESIFSRSRSPTAGVTSVPFEGAAEAPWDPSGMPPPPPPPKAFASIGTEQQQQQQQQRRVSRGMPLAPPLQQQMSAIQKIFKGIAGDGTGSTLAATDGCRNCRGRDASMTWDTVGLLRDENKALKYRVGELEAAVESALDAVCGVGL